MMHVNVMLDDSPVMLPAFYVAALLSGVLALIQLSVSQPNCIASISKQNKTTPLTSAVAHVSHKQAF